VNVQEKKPSTKAAKATKAKPKAASKPKAAKKVQAKVNGTPAKGMPTKEDLEHQHYNEIRNTSAKLTAAEVEFGEINIQHKAAKDQLKSLQLKLKQITARGPDMQLKLQFEDGKKATSGKGKKPEAKAAAALPPQPTDAEDDSWKQTPITEVLTGLSKAEYEKLEDLGVKTFIQLEDLRAGKNDLYRGGFQSVKGWGEAKITKYENLVADWWAKRQRSAVNKLASDEKPGTATLTLGNQPVEVAVKDEANPDLIPMTSIRGKPASKKKTKAK
jgi:hypothetical protein